MPIFNRYVKEVMESSDLLEPIEGLDKMINEGETVFLFFVFSLLYVNYLINKKIMIE